MIKGIRLTQIEKNGEILKYITTGNQICIVYPYEMHSNGTQPQMPCEFYAFQVNLSDPGNMFGLNHEYSYALCRLLTGMRFLPEIDYINRSVRLLFYFRGKQTKAVQRKLRASGHTALFHTLP